MFYIDSVNATCKEDGGAPAGDEAAFQQKGGNWESRFLHIKENTSDWQHFAAKR